MTPPSEDVARLLAEAGLPGAFQLAPLAGGANNRVYRVDCPAGAVLLKAYFRHADDPRDRLEAEFSFSRFAWEHGLRCLPRPLACNRPQNLGLFEFIAGRALAAEEVGAAEVQQAIDFFAALNRHKAEPDALRLRPASEACFTLAEHLACLDRRLARLAAIDASTPIGREAQTLVRQELAPAGEKIRASVLGQARGAGLRPDEPLAAGDRCLSPSDFGFHNAILGGDGRLRFIDFEYAGWDDPAKTACDFCCQPAVPVSRDEGRRFAQAVVSGLSDPEAHLRRISWLLPVYQLKWCCILLNEFLPVASRRRAFASDLSNDEERKAAQLQKARRAFREIHGEAG
jgi:hypothetical protein